MKFNFHIHDRNSLLKKKDSLQNPLDESDSINLEDITNDDFALTEEMINFYEKKEMAR